MSRAVMFRRLSTLRRDRSGVALIEFAYTLPFMLLLSLSGAELTNYITTRMRVSQLALQVVDNAARIGRGTQLQAKQINEGDINDLFIGAALQSGTLDIANNGRIILSSLENDPANAGKYRIRWQRCTGAKVEHASTFGDEGDANLDGIGPVGRQATVTDNNATMFVQIFYEYQPLIETEFAPDSLMMEYAAMMVRDRRDLSQVYPVSGLTPSTC